MREIVFQSVLANRLSDFVTFKRLGGRDYRSQIRLLEYFDRFLCQEGFTGQWPTSDLVQRYLAGSKHLQPRGRGNRFSVVRQFCSYLRQFEPMCHVPEKKLVIERRASRLPHIFTEREIKALLEAARDLPPSGSLRPQTYYTFFGLLWTTGLRCGEAMALNLDDVDIDRRLLYVRQGKFGKSRWVPLSLSTCRVLRSYTQRRTAIGPPAREAPLFINLRHHRLHHQHIYDSFRKILRQCGLRGGKGSPGPRIHDLRHSFACHRLLLWYRQGQDVNALLPALATYLGHIKVTSTQVYLRATAELLEQANKRFHHNFLHNILQKGEQE
ncbi:MAG: tyrosine-type recombinase/integrase [Candidatus Binatia bacterium]